MAIAFDATSSVNSTGNGNITLSHTCTGSNLILFVGISASVGSAVPTGVTYNGVTMTQIGSAVQNTDSGANAHLTVWRLVAPTTGAHNIVASFSGAPGDRGVVGVSLTGVDQTTPIGTQATNTTNNTTAPTVTVSSATGELVIDFHAAHNSLASSTAGSGQTKRGEILGSTALISSTEAGASSVVMNWTVGTSRWFSSMGIPIKPVGGAAQNPVNKPSGYQPFLAQ